MSENDKDFKNKVNKNFYKDWHLNLVKTQKFDTWFNNGDDPGHQNDHVGINYNGIVNHTDPLNAANPVVDLGNIEDGNFHPVIIEWDAATNNFKVTYSKIDSPDFKNDYVTKIQKVIKKNKIKEISFSVKFFPFR